MKYKEHFDHLGNRHYTTTDREGVFIIVVMLAILLALGVWL